MTETVEFTSTSVEQTYQLGRAIGERLPARAIVLLKGNLGAGKTTLSQGIASVRTTDAVTSPTYVYHQRYGTPGHVIDHIDLYRLESNQQRLEQLGLADLIDAPPGWLLIEWPWEQLALPADVPVVIIDALGQPTYSYRISSDDEQLFDRMKEIA